MDLGGILPGDQGVEEKKEIKLPKRIPDDSIWPVASQDDVDAVPRGAIAHLKAWDDELALDLIVAGAGITLLSRADKEALEAHDDFDPDGFGVLEKDGLWLPGLDVAYQRDGDGWALPEQE